MRFHYPHKVRDQVSYLFQFEPSAFTMEPNREAVRFGIG